MTLRVAGCSVQAARYAVTNWHYSHKLPGYGKYVRYGAWEDGAFVGAVVFGRGASPWLGTQHGLTQAEVCELVRVALREHTAPVSQIVARSLRLLKADNPGLRLVVSFADTKHRHHGGIYQAGNWVYTGVSHAGQPTIRLNGVDYHPRTLGSKYGTGGTSLAWLREHVDPDVSYAHDHGTVAKHRYLYPLDKAMRRQVLRKAQPYPEPVR